MLLAGRQVPIHEQKAAFNAMLGRRTDPDYREVNYQETDDGHGAVWRIFFELPKDAAAPPNDSLKTKKVKSAK
jgi:hypothetical protein